jgi:hypothetical protein
MKTPDNYKPYPKPRTALFIQNGDNYVKDTKTGTYGWEKIEKEVMVIGEDDYFFITVLKEHRVCDTEDPEYGKIVLLPLGFHKSRFIKWIDQ